MAGAETATLGADGGGEEPPHAGSGAHEGSNALAVGSSRGGAHGGDIPQPPVAATNHDEGHPVEESADRGGDQGRTSRSRNQQWQLGQGDVLSDAQMKRWREEHAPRVCDLRTGAQHSLWAKKQLEEQDLPAQQRQVLDGFWAQARPEGNWQFHNGILPSFGMEDNHQTIGLFNEEGAWMEKFYEEGLERSLSKSSKKGVIKGIKQLVVAEVFSPPRVSSEAEKMGHRSGGAYDLETGYDLTTPRDRRRVMKYLREEDPDLLVVCPPCGPFSALQHLNVAQHGYKTLQFKLAEGKEHLRFGMRIFEWQARRGKSAVFEHPATSAAWNEEEVKQVMRLPNVTRVRADQCEYGLAVQGVRNKKPTDFLVTGHGLATQLSKRCSGQHRHQPLMGGLARLAQQYPQALCQAMIRGAEEDNKHKSDQAWATGGEATAGEARDLEDLLEDAIDRDGSGAPRIHDAQRPTQDEKAVEEPHDEEEEESGKELSRSDKQLIHKLHCNLGHPSNVEFAKALRMARARGAVWRYVKDEYTCSSCERNGRPKPARPAMLPRSFEPCKTLGIDVVYFPGLDARKAVPVLNMTDLATGYQMLEPLDGVTSNQVWEKFYGSWARVFSLPEVILVDQGREFYKDFATKVSEACVLLKVIGARAPWQQGRTERHGGLAKEVFIKIREDVLPTTWAEWKLCIYAVEAAKNRMYNRSGFSPAQRQLGYNLRLPGSLGSDDVYDPATMVQSTSGDMQRLLEIRHAAMQAFIKHTTSIAVAKAAKARSRTTTDFKVGDIVYVYVYRVPLQRRRVRGEEEFEDREGRRATWVGPGTIVMTEGANAWLSIRGELWKCAKEQLRKATEEEAEARELLNEEFEELRLNMVRKASKRGFKDVTHWPRPEGEEEEEEAGERPRQRPRVEDPGNAEDGRDGEYTPESPVGTVAEPMEEPAREEMERQAAESHQRCEQLDGTLSRRPPGAPLGVPRNSTPAERIGYGPVRNKHTAIPGDNPPEEKASYQPVRGEPQARRWNPYRGGMAPAQAEDEEDDEGAQEDLWVYDEERQVIARYHQQARAVRFTPSIARGCPIHPKYLTSERRTVKKFGDGSSKVQKENWRSSMGKTEGQKEEGPLRWWTGYTEFKLRRTPPEVIYMTKRGSDEVREEDILPEEWEGWKIADAAEWAKVEATGAVKTLSVEESQDVERQLTEAQAEAENSTISHCPEMETI